MKKLLFLGILCVSTIVVSLSFSYELNATTTGDPATTTEISGYAWSSNIGWISFKGDNYGVLLDHTTGELSGYAWSSNIGWISFNSSDLSDCPTGSPCAAQYSDDVFSGWAKALSADGNGWDGWIHLSGSDYGLVHSNGTISGFMWGGEVIGWIEPKTMIMNVLLCKLGSDDDGDGINNEFDVDCGAVVTECNDTINNDPQEDELVDFPNDPDCDDFTDDKELSNTVSTAPQVELLVGIGSPAFESINIGKAQTTLKLLLNVSNASSTTSCSKQTISQQTSSTVAIPTNGQSDFTLPEDISVNSRTKIVVSCTTGTETGSDSVDILIKSENEF